MKCDLQFNTAWGELKHQLVSEGVLTYAGVLLINPDDLPSLNRRVVDAYVNESGIEELKGVENLLTLGSDNKLIPNYNLFKHVESNFYEKLEQAEETPPESKPLASGYTRGRKFDDYFEEFSKRLSEAFEVDPEGSFMKHLTSFSSLFNDRDLFSEIGDILDGSENSLYKSFTVLSIMQSYTVDAELALGDLIYALEREDGVMINKKYVRARMEADTKNVVMDRGFSYKNESFNTYGPLSRRYSDLLIKGPLIGVLKSFKERVRIHNRDLGDLYKRLSLVDDLTESVEIKSQKMFFGSRFFLGFNVEDVPFSYMKDGISEEGVHSRMLNIFNERGITPSFKFATGLFNLNVDGLVENIFDMVSIGRAGGLYFTGLNDIYVATARETYPSRNPSEAYKKATFDRPGKIFVHELTHYETARWIERIEGVLDNISDDDFFIESLLEDPDSMKKVIAKLKLKGIEDSEHFFKLYELFTLAREHAAIKGERYYGLTNIHEFLAEFYSNREFVNFLRTVPYEGEGRSFVDAIIQLIAKILKIDTPYLTEILYHAEKVKAQGVLLSNDSVGKGGGVDTSSHPIHSTNRLQRLTEESGLPANMVLVHSSPLPPIEGDVTVFNELGLIKNGFTESTEPLDVLDVMVSTSLSGIEIPSSLYSEIKSKVVSGFLDTLTKEEWRSKWNEFMLNGKDFSHLFSFLRKSGIGDKYFPELMTLQGVSQDPRWNPEGDVEEHTSQAMQAGYDISERDNLVSDSRLVLMYGALLHKIGKPVTTKVESDGRVTSRGHERSGLKIARGFLNKIGMSEEVVDRVEAIIEDQLAHSLIRSLPTLSRKKKAFENVVRRVGENGLPDLMRLMESDMSGRNNKNQEAPDSIFEFYWLNDLVIDGKFPGLTSMPSGYMPTDYGPKRNTVSDTVIDSSSDYQFLRHRYNFFSTFEDADFLTLKSCEL